MSFIFGGNTGMSYEDVQRKREIAQALTRGMGKAPQNVGEGLHAIGMALAARGMNKRADEAEKKGRTQADSVFSALLGGQKMAQPTTGAFSGSGGDMAKYRDAIASIESAGSGDYQAVGPTNPRLGRALGRYQVMEANIGPWSKAALGREISADEFLANPQLQDAIFDHRFGGYVEKFGPEGAAQAWFAGPGGVGKTNRSDVLGTSVGEYSQKFNNALGVSQGTRVAQSGPGVQELMAAMSNPYMRPEQKQALGIMLQQQMQASDPMYQLQLQNMQSQIDARNKPNPMDAINLEKAQIELNDMKQPKERPTVKAADGYLYYADGEKERVFPGVQADTSKDMTESERRIFMFNSMQKDAGPVINLIEEKGFDPSNFKDRFAGGVLGGNFVKSRDGQMYDAAANAWSEAALRLATGAAATPEEHTRIKGTYFAQAGDSLETIQFKRAMRESYQGVLSRTLSGETSEAPNPLLFAAEQIYSNENATAAPAVKQPERRPAQGQSQNDGPPPGVDPELWEYMTPEDRALFR